MLFRVIGHPLIVGIEEPAVAAFDDGGGGRDAETEQPALAIPADERGAKAEMVVKPAAEAVAERRDRRPCGVEMRKGSELAILRAGIGAVVSGEVRAERQPDRHEEQNDQQGTAGLMSRATPVGIAGLTSCTTTVGAVAAVVARDFSHAVGIHQNRK